MGISLAEFCVRASVLEYSAVEASDETNMFR